MNKKKIIGIIAIVVALILCVVPGIILNKKENTVNSNVELQNAEEKENNENSNNENKVADVQEERIENIENASKVSSRSEIDRTAAIEKVEENYIKIEDVKISFNMDVSKTTGLSKEDFITFVSNMKYDRTGILEKNAGCIWELCHKYNVNEIFVIGICGIESGWCSAPQHQRTHNYSSLMSGGKLIPYETDEQGFEAMIKLLGERYLKPSGSFYHGATITGVGTCYCNPTSWPSKVYTCMTQAFQ